jgi:transcriptional accessory protein Tex/SPT6
MVQVTPHKPGESRLITDAATSRCESELLMLTAAVNEIDAFIANERQTYLTRLKPELEAHTTDDKDVWDISEDSYIHMQCLEQNLQAAINRLQELKKSTEELRAGIELSQDKCAVLFGMDKTFAPIIS